MRKFISLVVALLALTTCLAELNSAFNGDVQRFHDEYSMSQRLASRPNAIGRQTFVSPHVENGVEMIDAFIDFATNPVFAHIIRSVAFDRIVFVDYALNETRNIPEFVTEVRTGTEWHSIWLEASV